MPWNSVPCHPSVVQNIRVSIARGMFNPSTLLHGPPGAGQEEVGRAIAMTLACGELEDDFCGECPVCRRVAAGSHPDIVVTEPKDGKVNYPIEQIREIQEMASYYPYEGGKRVFALNHAHRMDAPAANCFLKILEEPYPYLYFILMSDNLSGFLPTILSRCGKIRLLPLPLDAMAGEVPAGLDADEAETLARASGGLPERARELHESGYLEMRGQMIEMLGRIAKGEVHIPAAVDELAPSRAAKPERKRAEREELILKLGILCRLLRDGAALAGGGKPFNPGLEGALGKMWPGGASDALISSFEKAIDAVYAHGRSYNMHLVLTELLLEVRAAMTGRAGKSPG